MYGSARRLQKGFEPRWTRLGILLSSAVRHPVLLSVVIHTQTVSFHTDVHQFDAQEIPFDGPDGIIARAERLLDKSSNLSQSRKRRLIDSLVRIILQNA